MTWEETIIQIRRQPEYAELVEKAYLEEDMVLNVTRFKDSREFFETKKILGKYFSALSSVKILDVGSGNGISAVAFAIDGAEVCAVEPDPSNTVGSGAIRKLKEHYSLSNLSVFESYAEELPFDAGSFDLVYVRQAMHHARDLKGFVKELSRVLRPGGVLLTIRDHVVFGSADKKRFLEHHQLQKYYHGENAFSVDEYETAIRSAGFKIISIFRYFDSVINFYPEDESSILNARNKRQAMVTEVLSRKLPAFLARNEAVISAFTKYLNYKLGPALDEKNIPGRMYSFLAIKTT